MWSPTSLGKRGEWRRRIRSPQFCGDLHAAPAGLAPALVPLPLQGELAPGPAEGPQGAAGPFSPPKSRGCRWWDVRRPVALGCAGTAPCPPASGLLALAWPRRLNRSAGCPAPSSATTWSSRSPATFPCGHLASCPHEFTATLQLCPDQHQGGAMVTRGSPLAESRRASGSGLRASRPRDTVLEACGVCGPGAHPQRVFQLLQSLGLSLVSLLCPGASRTCWPGAGPGLTLPARVRARPEATP